MKRFGFKKVLMFITLFIAAIIVFGSIVMLLWNNILSVVIGVKTITFLQALGILLLSKILFGGFGGRGRGGWQRGRHNQWGNNMREKFAGMTPEEKEKFKAEWRNRCGSRGWRMGKENSSDTMAG